MSVLNGKSETLKNLNFKITRMRFNICGSCIYFKLASSQKRVSRTPVLTRG